MLDWQCSVGGVVPIMQPGATRDASRAPHSGLPELLQGGQEPLRTGREPGYLPRPGPERFFPEPGEQTEAAEAKAIRAGWQVPNHCRDLAVKAAGGIDADHGVFGGCLPAGRSRLRGTTFPESSAYRQRRELAEQAHQLAGQVGLRQAARQLGIHRDALKAAFAHWGLPALALRVGWQPSRFLTDRAEAERAFRLAERLGSVRHGEKRPRRLGRSFRRVIT